MDTYGYAVSNSSVYETIDYDALSVESYDIAITLYDGVTPNETVPQDYLDQNIPVAYQQIMKGGYRLYYTIDFIFSSASSSPTEIEQTAGAISQNSNLELDVADILQVYEAIYGTLFKEEPTMFTE